MKLPKGLSYRRSLENSIGFFFQTNSSGQKKPVILDRKTLVGPFSDIASASGSNQKNTNALNVFRTDLAELAGDTSQLSIECHLSFLQNWCKPYRSENSETIEYLTAFTDAYHEIDGLTTLSSAYAENILSLAWCWRNTEVFKTGRQCEVEFDDTQLTFTVPDSAVFPNISDIIQSNSKESVSAVIDFIKAALTGSAINTMRLSGVFQSHPGMEAYPSQEFKDEDSKSGKFAKVRELSSTSTHEGERQAIFHKSKIANAFHRVDRWYENTLDAPAINVNPLGYEQQENKTYRSWKSHLDIYHQLMNIENITEDLLETKTPSPNSHYLAACLLRGGLFTAKKDGDSTK